jgi:hypothetical protein
MVSAVIRKLTRDKREECEIEGLGRDWRGRDWKGRG